MKISISRKIASDHNPPALKRTCVLTLDFSSQSALSMWFPLARELPGKSVSFHLLPLREAYSCSVVLLPWESLKGWLSVVLATGSPEREKDVPLWLWYLEI